jgi:hypothetical protein
MSDASGANVWGAGLGDAMNGDSGTAPHPDSYADIESGAASEQDDDQNEPDAPGYNVPVPAGMDI